MPTTEPEKAGNKYRQQGLRSFKARTLAYIERRQALTIGQTQEFCPDRLTTFQ